MGRGVAQEPPQWAVEGMTAFSAAAMLTDAFLHQLPHALASHDDHHDSVRAQALYIQWPHASAKREAKNGQLRCPVVPSD